MTAFGLAKDLAVVCCVYFLGSWFSDYYLLFWLSVLAAVVVVVVLAVLGTFLPLETGLRARTTGPPSQGLRQSSEAIE